MFKPFETPVKIVISFLTFFFAAFQNVPSANATAAKLMTNFLGIYPGISVRRKRKSIIKEDIVVVMDGSGSVGSCEFGKGQKALKYMMELASNKTTFDTKYAGVTFASSAAVNFKFLPYANSSNEIMKISYPGGATNTQAGLVEAKKLFDDPLSGAYL